MLSRVIEAGEEENSYLLTFHGRFGGKRFGYEIHFLGKPLFSCVVRDRSPLQPPMCTLVECSSFPLLQALAAYSLSATIKPYLSMVFSPCLVLLVAGQIVNLFLFQQRLYCIAIHTVYVTFSS